MDQRLKSVRASLANACESSGRQADDVLLLAVSKTQPAEAVRAAARAGQRHFGENYLQEAQEKIRALAAESLTWHFIGPIQSNKTRDIAADFDWVHSVDREKIARRLSEQRPAGRDPLQICIQVNISDEDSKSGVAPAAVLPLAQSIAALPGLSLRGLMAIPAPDAQDPQAPFAQLRELLEQLRGTLGDNAPLDTLSMGMSGDYPQAIAEGATIVRIGTAIFGARQ